MNQLNDVQSVKAVKLFIEKRNTMPIIGAVACNGKMTATDLESWIVVNREAPRGLVAGCYEPADLENVLNGATGVKAYAKLDEYPSWPSPKISPVVGEEKTVELGLVELQSLAKVLKAHMLSSSQDATRYNINGVYFATNGDIASTDGHRLFRSKNCLPFACLADTEMIVTNGFCAKLIKLAALLKRERIEFRVSRTGMYLHLKSDSLSLATRLLDGKFPAYEDVIPKGYDKSFEIYPLFLSELEKRTKNTEGKYGVTFCRITSDGACTVEQENGAKVVLNMFRGEHNDGKDIPFTELTACNRRYLVDALNQTGCVGTKIRLGERVSAIMFEHGDSIAVVMPVHEPKKK